MKLILARKHTDLLLLALVSLNVALVSAVNVDEYKPRRMKKQLWRTDAIPNITESGQSAVYRGAAVGVPFDPAHYIVGGEDAAISRFPYQAALLITQNGYFYQICGGSLVTSTKIVTAAHCVEDDGSETYYILMGLGDLRENTDPNLQLIQVQSVVKHENYNDGLTNDVAVLTLSSAMTITDHVKTIKLAWFIDGFPCYFRSCSVSGWGSTQDDNNKFVLQSSKFKIQSIRSCRREWEDFAGTGASSLINYSQVCIKNKNSSPCFGDSGGPLTCNGRLTGIVSWGHPQCQINFPAVFTRVDYFSGWIKRNI